MGILASTARLMELTNFEHDLSVKRQELASEMHSLTAEIAENKDYMSDIHNPNDPVLIRMKSELAELNERERVLKDKQVALDTQMQEVSQELQACRQYLSQTIQSSGFFTYGLGGGR